MSSLMSKGAALQACVEDAMGLDSAKLPITTVADSYAMLRREYYLSLSRYSSKRGMAIAVFNL
jgi:hypothetical protein